MRKFGTFFLIVFFFIGCINKNSPEYRLRQYLTALKNKNFEKAKKYCEKTAVYNLECAIRMGTTDFGINEIRDIKCKISNNQADCKFCCMNNELSPEFRLIKTKDEWMIVGVKELCPLDDIPNSEADSLTSDTTNL